MDEPSQYPKAWKGAHYAKGFNGVRLLALGESSYGDTPTSPHSLVEDHIRGPARHHWHRTYSRFLWLLDSQGTWPSTLEQRQARWDQIAFTNYLIEVAGPGARKRPARESWGRSLAPFLAFLKTLKPLPDAVIVWGFPPWYALQGDPTCQWGAERHQCLQWNKEKAMGFIHWPDGPPLPAFALAHPSSPATTQRKWGPKLAAFLIAATNSAGGVKLP